MVRTLERQQLQLHNTFYFYQHYYHYRSIHNYEPIRQGLYLRKSVPFNILITILSTEPAPLPIGSIQLTLAYPNDPEQH